MVISVDPLYTYATMRKNIGLTLCIYSINERLQGGATAKTIYATVDAVVALLGMMVAGGCNRVIV